MDDQQLIQALRTRGLEWVLQLVTCGDVQFRTALTDGDNVTAWEARAIAGMVYFIQVDRVPSGRPITHAPTGRGLGATTAYDTLVNDRPRVIVLYTRNTKERRRYWQQAIVHAKTDGVQTTVLACTSDGAVETMWVQEAGRVVWESAD